jgi:hypothetical protein
LGKLGSITKAATFAGVSRETIRLWERDDRSGFRQKLRDAHATYADMLESMALERVQNPEGNRGSDTLLIALNNANSEKWKGNQVSVVVEDSVLQALTSLQALDAATRAPLPAPAVVEGEAVVEKLPWE